MHRTSLVAVPRRSAESESCFEGGASASRRGRGDSEGGDSELELAREFETSYQD